MMQHVSYRIFSNYACICGLTDCQQSLVTLQMVKWCMLVDISCGRDLLFDPNPFEGLKQLQPTNLVSFPSPRWNYSKECWTLRHAIFLVQKNLNPWHFRWKMEEHFVHFYSMKNGNLQPTLKSSSVTCAIPVKLSWKTSSETKQNQWIPKQRTAFSGGAKCFTSGSSRGKEGPWVVGSGIRLVYFR